MAEIDVWKFHDGDWYHDEFVVAAGDPLGQSSDQFEPLRPALQNQGLLDNALVLRRQIDFGTGATVVALDFQYKLARPEGGLGLDQQTLRLVYIEQPDDLQDQLQIEDAKRMEQTRELLGIDEQVEPDEGRRDDPRDWQPRRPIPRRPGPERPYDQPPYQERPGLPRE
jgi:hypothetical protein